MKLMLVYLMLVLAMNLNAMLPYKKKQMNDKTIAQVLKDLRVNRNIVVMNLNLALQVRVINEIKNKNLQWDAALIARLAFVSEQLSKLEAALDTLNGGIDLIDQMSYLVPLDKVTPQTTFKRFLELKQQALDSTQPSYFKEIVVKYWKQMDV